MAQSASTHRFMPSSGAAKYIGFALSATMTPKTRYGQSTASVKPLLRASCWFSASTVASSATYPCPLVGATFSLGVPYAAASQPIKTSRTTSSCFAAPPSTAAM